MEREEVKGGKEVKKVKGKKLIKILFVILSVIVVFSAGSYVGANGMAMIMPPIVATLPQDAANYDPDEKLLLEISQEFWAAMENADEAGMRAIADPDCTFVHIGMTCKLDEEIGFYTSGMFNPTSIVFHGQSVDVFGDTAVVITDCDYALEMGASSTSHHFAVTEVYARQGDEWKLVQFSFTALVS